MAYLNVSFFIFHALESERYEHKIMRNKFRFANVITDLSALSRKTEQ